jgi:chloride channel 2
LTKLGLWIGKEGPMIHIGAMVVKRMFYFFKSKRIQRLALELINAGVACGVAVNFGALLGGVLFAIEVTATYFPVNG